MNDPQQNNLNKTFNETSGYSRLTAWMLGIGLTLLVAGGATLFVPGDKYAMQGRESSDAGVAVIFAAFLKSELKI